MDIKREFVELTLREGANRRELCRRFGISAKTGYALLARHAQEEAQAYTARSTRPVHSPTRTAAQMEQAVVALRCEHPSRGGRKIARRLSDLGHRGVPMPSTVTAILHRHGLIAAQASAAAQHWQRFEHEAPNALWQIDFKGDFDTGRARCYPLTLQRWLQGVQAQPGRLPVRLGAVAPSAAQRSRAYRRTRADRAASARSRARWQAAYEEARRRHGWGESLLAIGRSMALARSTVRSSHRPETFPNGLRAGPVRPSCLPHPEYLAAWLSQGCENAPWHCGANSAAEASQARPGRCNAG